MKGGLIVFVYMKRRDLSTKNRCEIWGGMGGGGTSEWLSKMIG